MNKKNLLLALAAAVALSTQAGHAAPVTLGTQSGDILLGFEDTSLNKNYIVDLGDGSGSATDALLSSFASFNISADLVTVFGASWYTDTNLKWGLFGFQNDSINNNANPEVWASVQKGNQAPVKKTWNQLSATDNRFNAITLNISNIQDTTDTSGGVQLTKGTELLVGTGSSTGFNTWTGNNPTSAPFAAYASSIEASITNQLDLYGTFATSQSKLNTIQISSAGLVSAVPEPSTYALFGLASLIAAVVYRRKAANQKA